MNNEAYDVVIVGCGPAGIGCAIEAKRLGFKHLVLDKGSVCNSIRRYPENLHFFSTPELLALAGIPFTTARVRPTRDEVLQYYRQLVDLFRPVVSLYEGVESLRREDGSFVIQTSRDRRIESGSVILATGYYDWPNRLCIPGEDLPHVSHYYTGPYAYPLCRVVVVGGGNSAAEAALDLYRHGAVVTLVHRGQGIGDDVKYWLKPDFENRIKEGAIAVRFGKQPAAISTEEVELAGQNDEKERLAADFVLLLTGFHTDTSLLESAGAEIDPATAAPIINQDTLETTVPRLFVAGTAVCGRNTSGVFIENGRNHPEKIFQVIAG